MKNISILSILLLSACVNIQQQKITDAITIFSQTKNVKCGAIEDYAKIGAFKAVKCKNDLLVKLLSNEGYPYMDLVYTAGAHTLDVANQFDKSLIGLQDYRVLIAKIDAAFLQEQELRKKESYQIQRQKSQDMSRAFNKLSQDIKELQMQGY